MKKAGYLVLIAICLLVASASPADASAPAAPIEPPGPGVLLDPSINSINSPSKLFLPLTLRKFLPPCGDTPEKLRSLFGASLLAYYPLWERSGGIVEDLSPNDRTGVYLGNPALGQVQALCGRAPRFDGVNDWANVFSPSLASAFNGSEGTAIIQLKIEPQQWTDGQTSYYLALRANASNHIVLYKAANHQLLFTYTAGGNSYTAEFNDMSTSRWVTYAITWSKANDRVTGYVAGETMQPVLHGLAAWSGGLTSAEIGGYMGNAANYAKGSISSVVLLNREASAAEVREYSAIFGARKVLSVLGDSIAWVYYRMPWSLQAVFDYEGGNQVTLKSHAASGQGIMEYMDAQTLAAANDDADMLIIALGRVDDNNGDMAALQAEVEENVAELKASNPRAAIYYMNVLPSWTDQSGQTEVDLSRIRATIAAACASQNITCWDTYTNPWITPADTIDGTHPNAAGQLKIASRVLQRIGGVGEESLVGWDAER